MAARFWVGGTGNWDASDTTHWATGTGGAGGASVPADFDAVTLDAASGGGTVTLTAAPNKVSVTMGAFTGTFDAGSISPTFSSFNCSGTGVRTLNMGSGTWTISNTIAWSWTLTTTTNLTFNKGTANIKITGSGTTFTFSGGSLTYNNLWISVGVNGVTTTIADSNTFTDFKDDSSTHTIKFTDGSTTTVSTFTVSGTSGHLITITGSSTGTHTLSAPSGDISCDYLNIQHSIATGGAAWYAGANSTNNQGVSTPGSGWIFTAPPMWTISLV